MKRRSRPAQIAPAYRKTTSYAPVGEIAMMGVTDATIHRWKAWHGDVDKSETRRLSKFNAENRSKNRLSDIIEKMRA